MNTINRYQTLIIAIAVALGLTLGKFSSFSIYAKHLIVPALTLMLFGIFLNINIKQFLNSFSNKKFFSASIVINFIWTPIFAYVLGYIFLKNEYPLWIGFLMLMVTPCTDWYLIFTGIAKGNTTLSASILPINLILQIILLPVYIFIFFGKSTAVDLRLLVGSVFFILVLPFVLAQGIKWLFIKKKEIKKLEIISTFFENVQLIFLAIAIMAMFASQGDYLINNLSTTMILLIPLGSFYTLTFIIGRVVSKMLKFSYEDSASLNLTTLARNSPISLAIAMTAFPNEPFIALALVIAPLIELPVLGIIAQLLLSIRKRSIKG